MKIKFETMCWGSRGQGVELLWLSFIVHLMRYKITMETHLCVEGVQKRLAEQRRLPKHGSNHATGWGPELNERECDPRIRLTCLISDYRRNDQECHPCTCSPRTKIVLQLFAWVNYHHNTVFTSVVNWVRIHTLPDCRAHVFCFCPG